MYANRKKSIAVLLSTYNGEKYLKEQLQSLYIQEGAEISLLVRDDGSTYDRINILDEWQSKGLLSWYSSGNLGPGKSFMHLLKTAKPGCYYAFCDQDDVWLPEKLRLTMDKMKTVEQANPGKPVIIHTDMYVVNENLETIHKSFWRSSGLRPDILRTFPYLCTCNSVNGCTILMNSIARQLVLEKYVEHDVIIHDVISALTVSYYGGIIDYVDSPTVLYRQHASNVVGAMEYSKTKVLKNRLFNIKKVVANNIKQFKDINKIGNITFLTYICHKVKYLLIR